MVTAYHLRFTTSVNLRLQRKTLTGFYDSTARFLLKVRNDGRETYHKNYGQTKSHFRKS